MGSSSMHQKTMEGSVRCKIILIGDWGSNNCWGASG